MVLVACSHKLMFWRLENFHNQIFSIGLLLVSAKQGCGVEHNWSRQSATPPHRNFFAKMGFKSIQFKNWDLHSQQGTKQQKPKLFSSFFSISSSFQTLNFTLVCVDVTYSSLRGVTVLYAME